MYLSDTQFFGVYAFAPVHKDVTNSGQSNGNALRRDISQATYYRPLLVEQHT